MSIQIDRQAGTLEFEKDRMNRVRLHDVQDIAQPGETNHFHIFGLKNGSIHLSKDDIDDLVLILQEVQRRGYKVE